MDAWLTPAGLAVMFGIASTIVGVWYRLDTKIGAKTEKIADDLSAFKLQAAREFASTSQLKEVEIRLITTIEKLTERIDRLIDRMDRQREDR